MSNPSQSSSLSDRRSFQILGGRNFSFTMNNTIDCAISTCTTVAETFILLLGPLLICFASAIISGLSWVFFTIYLPMMQFDLNQKEASPLRYYFEIFGNVTFVVFILIEIVFNYFMCVTTRNAGPSSSYDVVVRELAESTNLDYPKTAQAVARFRRDFNDKIAIRMRRRREREAEENERQNALSRCCDGNEKCSSKSGLSDNGITSTATPSLATSICEEDAMPSNSSAGNTATGENVTLRKNTRQQKSTNKNINRNRAVGSISKVRNWMLMAPDEWGYCMKTNQPKPPRSHYDHVSKSLVLCLDHYCPWMFNASKFS